MGRATKKQIEDSVIKMSEKYEDLVWYTRSGRNIDIPSVMSQRNRLEDMYPKETEELSSESGDWSHGFNSGMLAGMRYILTMMEYTLEDAEENFPELDT
jgi:hypothetical protein